MLCLVVGESNSGKTSLCKCYRRGEAITEDNVSGATDPTVKSFPGSEISRPNAVSLLVRDTDGSVGIHKDEEADAIVICFDIVKPPTLVQVKAKWAPAVKTSFPGKPFFLVGCKSDLRGEIFEGIEVPSTTTQQGEDMAKEIGAEKYYEFSARNAVVDPKEIFLAATIAALPPPPKEAGGCCVLS